MKINELNGLYVAYSLWRDYRILICANEELEAKAAAESYGNDVCIEDFVVSTLDEALEGVGGDINKLRFDCDYVVVPSEDDIFNAFVESTASLVNASKLTASSKFVISFDGSCYLAIVYDSDADNHEEVILMRGDHDNVEKVCNTLEERFGICDDPFFTFRLEGSIRFNKTIPKEHCALSIGGFEMTMAGKSVQFDFEEWKANIDEDEPNLLHFECKNPDEDTFEDIACINKFMLSKVEAITEFYVESTELDENNHELGEQTLLPINIESLKFVLPYEDFKSISVSKEVVTKFVESEWKDNTDE